MSGINCFKECFSSNQEEDSTIHQFKLKKKKKCIALTKNCKSPTHNQQLATFSSAMTQNRIEDNFTKGQTNKISRSQKLENILQEKHCVCVKSKVDQVQMPDPFDKPVFRANQQRTKNIPQRTTHQRRYSLDSTLKTSYVPVKTTYILPKEPQKDHLQQSKILIKIKPDERRSPTKYEIKTIKQVSEEKQKSSSLFQGAKSIVNRMTNSHKKQKTVSIDPIIIQTVQKKKEKDDMSRFYADCRLCETQIMNTHSSIASQEQQKKIRHFCEPIQDTIPMSPRTRNNMSNHHFWIGRLLGVGKWAHVFLCQEKSTHTLYAIKEIFKQSFKMTCSFQQFNKSLDYLISLHHSNLVNIFTKFQTKDKLFIVSEFCNGSVFDEIKQSSILSMQKLKHYSSDLIKAVVFLHQNQIIHGSVNIFQAFTFLGQCKLKHSLSCRTAQDSNDSLSFKDDIQGLAVTLFELGYGLIPLSTNSETLYKKERLYQESKTKIKMLQFVKSRIQMPKTDLNYKHLNSLIKLLLHWQPGCRLTSSACLSHSFFQNSLAE